MAGPELKCPQKPVRLSLNQELCFCTVNWHSSHGAGEGISKFGNTYSVPSNLQICIAASGGLWEEGVHAGRGRCMTGGTLVSPCLSQRVED